MIRKLRVKLVAIIMAFVTVILACVMAAVLGLTREWAETGARFINHADFKTQ